jgi:hypothetical protein
MPGSTSAHNAPRPGSASALCVCLASHYQLNPAQKGSLTDLLSLPSILHLSLVLFLPLLLPDLSP